jgi:release factor glutamine methyltransferase
MILHSGRRRVRLGVAYGGPVTPLARKAAIVTRLRAAGCVFADDEADVLLATTTDAPELDAMVAARSAGMPLEQVVGWANFAGVRVRVHPGVFVPRRRTEALVRAAVAVTRSGAVVVDLCCGTGAIGAAIATAVPDLRLWASDVEPAAVECARENLAAWNAVVVLGDMDEAIPPALVHGVDVLVANAPYVPSGELEFMPLEARAYEPRVALDGGADGLRVLARIASRAPLWLRPGGWLFTECAVRQADRAEVMLRDARLIASVVHDHELDVAVVAGQRHTDDDHLTR